MESSPWWLIAAQSYCDHFRNVRACLCTLHRALGLELFQRFQSQYLNLPGMDIRRGHLHYHAWHRDYVLLKSCIAVGSWSTLQLDPLGNENPAAIKEQSGPNKAEMSFRTCRTCLSPTPRTAGTAQCPCQCCWHLYPGQKLAIVGVMRTALVRASFSWRKASSTSSVHTKGLAVGH